MQQTSFRWVAYDVCRSAKILLLKSEEKTSVNRSDKMLHNFYLEGKIFYSVWNLMRSFVDFCCFFALLSSRKYA